jgi:SAM-dependent methyltransferase
VFDASAEFYDLIYSGFKDYAAETEQLASLVRREHPGCVSVLDVACGTGEHVQRLAHKGYLVDGLDLNPAFLEIAKSKHPDGRFFRADMQDFHVPYKYDAILCLFSSIGYVRTIDGVARTLGCFREHLASGGVIVIEPWFPPGVLDPSRVMTNIGEANGVRVTRVGRVEVEGTVSRLRFDYEVSDGTGLRRLSEVHELGLFTSKELLATFEGAGLEAMFDPKGLTDRGLYIARLRD